MANAGKRQRYYEIACSEITDAPIEQWPKLKGLPEGYCIEAVSLHSNFHSNTVLLRVSHPSFDPLPDTDKPSVEPVEFVTSAPRS